MTPTSFLKLINEMRLTKQQTHTITQTVIRLAGTGSAVYLFGSRLNDQAKGGDIDLFIEFDTPLSLIHRAQIKAELLEAIQRCVYFLDASSRKLTSPLTKILCTLGMRLFRRHVGEMVDQL